jgi:hypothetical protein
MFSCGTDNGSAPVLTNVIMAPTQAMIDAGTDTTEFTVTDHIRLHYKVTDKDGDFDRAVTCIIDGNGEVVERKEDTYLNLFSGAKITEFSHTTAYPQGKFVVGSWSISIYYLDKAGNTSETVIKNFVVEEAPGD